MYWYFGLGCFPELLIGKGYISILILCALGRRWTDFSLHLLKGRVCGASSRCRMLPDGVIGAATETASSASLCLAVVHVTTRRRIDKLISQIVKFPESSFLRWPALIAINTPSQALTSTGIPFPWRRTAGLQSSSRLSPETLVSVPQDPRPPGCVVS